MAEEEAVVSSLSSFPSFLSLHFLSSRLTRRRKVRGGDDVSRMDGWAAAGRQSGGRAGGRRATHSLSDVFTKRVTAAPPLVLMLYSLEGCPRPPFPSFLCVPALGILIGFF